VLELVGHVLVPMVDGIVEVEVIHIVHIEIIVVVDQGKTKIAECVPYFFLLLMFLYPVMKFMSIAKGMILFNVHLILILVAWRVFGWFLMMF
jgi:hypothetical protein